MSRDILSATISLLSADAALVALVSTRIFGAELPPAEAPHMPRKAVVVRRGAGTAGRGGYLELEQAVLDVFCYGETPFEADKTRRAVADALKQARRQVISGTLIHSYDPSGGAQGLRDPDTQWPYSISTWRFLASEVEAT